MCVFGQLIWTVTYEMKCVMYKVDYDIVHIP